MKTILQCNGFTMHYATFGRGSQSYVMLPGLSLVHTSDSEAVVAAHYASLLDQYTFTLLDRREELPEAVSIHSLAEDSYQAMQLLGIKQAIVYGTSQGGMMALDLAEHHPEAVSALVLCSTSATNVKPLQACSEKWLEMVRRKDCNGLNASFLDWMFSERFLRANRERLLSGMRSYSPEELEHFARLIGAFARMDIQKGLSTIHCPVLVMGAANDQVMGGEAFRELTKALPCESYLYEDGYGHAVYDEAPDHIERISAFLSRLKKQNT